ncbi:hypothetical protein JCM11641_002492 [Rhodosporidiobolus odoratus]
MLPYSAARTQCTRCLDTLIRPHKLAPAHPAPLPVFPRFYSSPSTPSPLPTPPPSEESVRRAIPLPSPKGTPSPTGKLLDARARAETQLRALLKTVDSSARKQAQAFAAALHALEIERKLRDMGGRINQATGYEGIERLRSGVGEKEKTLLQSRAQAAELKQDYSARVKLRADSQREVNDLLQRKSTWNSADVLRFTELVQQDHENERAEGRAKLAMDEGDQNVERGFSELMQAILERYHEEQVWSDKIRSLSTYGSLAITSLNVLLFIITLLLIEPWRRRKLVEKVEERLRTNTQEGHDATLAKLESFRALLGDAQTKLDEIAASTSALTAPAPPPLAPTSPSPLPPPHSPLIDSDTPLDTLTDAPASAPATRRSPLPYPYLEQAREAIEGHEMAAAGAAGAVGGILLAAVISLVRG